MEEAEGAGAWKSDQEKHPTIQGQVSTYPHLTTKLARSQVLMRKPLPLWLETTCQQPHPHTQVNPALIRSGGHRPALLIPGWTFLWLRFQCDLPPRARGRCPEDVGGRKGRAWCPTGIWALASGPQCSGRPPTPSSPPYPPGQCLLPGFGMSP